MKWANEEIDKAIMLNKSGIRFKEIAKSLGRTTKAVKIKLNRLQVNEIITNYRETIKCKNKFCENEFIDLKSLKRKFCSQSCALIYNNRNKRKHFKKPCLNCNNLTKNKYCNSSCLNEYKRKIIFEEIENNSFSRENKVTESRWYKKYLIEKYGEKCMKCGWNEKHPITDKIPIELEHKDGDSDNNSLENLELLCPNHHSLTPTYKALNAGNGRHSRRMRYSEGKSY